MTAQSPTLMTLAGERGIPNVNTVVIPRKKYRGFIFFIVLVVAFGVLLYFSFSPKKIDDTQSSDTPLTTTITSTVPPHTFTKPDPLPQTLTVKMPVPPPAPVVVEKTLPILDKSGSNLMIAQTQNKLPSSTTQAHTAHPSNAETGLGTLLTASNTTTRNATQLKNRHTLLAKGSFIECILQTRLDSTVPGMTSCVVTRSIYSDTGKVLLVERGSTVSGEYQSNVKQGQARIFVLWNRIKTPHGVVINLDSPGTDTLGGSGLPGFVDNHFWQRFGGALMLSLVQDAAAAATASMDSSDTTITFDSTSDATQNMATEALRNTINIPPTLYKNQGELIGIYVARDLNFGSVYDLKPE
jgi:type IV secretion system protein VirB10